MFPPEAKLTVVLCARNAAATVERQLRALCTDIARAEPQLGRIDVIVVDNGSTDATPQIFEHWAGKYDFMRLVSEPRAGVNRARNAGIAAVRSEKILLCDADDEVQPGWLQAMSAVLDTHDLAGSDLLVEDGRDHPAPLIDRPRTYEVLWGLSSPWGCSSGLKRSVWQDVGGFAPYLRIGGEEEDFFIRAQVRGFTLGWVDEPLMRYTVANTPEKLRFRARSNVVSRTHSYWYGRVRGRPRRPFAARNLRAVVSEVSTTNTHGRASTWNLVVCRFLRTAAAMVFAPLLFVTRRR